MTEVGIKKRRNKTKRQTMTVNRSMIQRPGKKRGNILGSDVKESGRVQRIRKMKGEVEKREEKYSSVL